MDGKRLGVAIVRRAMRMNKTALLSAWQTDRFFLGFGPARNDKTVSAAIGNLAARYHLCVAQTEQRAGVFAT